MCLLDENSDIRFGYIPTCQTIKLHKLFFFEFKSSFEESDIKTLVDQNFHFLLYYVSGYIRKYRDGMYSHHFNSHLTLKAFSYNSRLTLIKIIYAYLYKYLHTYTTYVCRYMKIECEARVLRLKTRINTINHLY